MVAWDSDLGACLFLLESGAVSRFLEVTPAVDEVVRAQRFRWAENSAGGAAAGVGPPRRKLSGVFRRGRSFDHRATAAKDAITRALSAHADMASAGNRLERRAGGLFRLDLPREAAQAAAAAAAEPAEPAVGVGGWSPADGPTGGPGGGGGGDDDFGTGFTVAHAPGVGGPEGALLVTAVAPGGQAEALGVEPGMWLSGVGADMAAEATTRADLAALLRRCLARGPGTVSLWFLGPRSRFVAFDEVGPDAVLGEAPVLLNTPHLVASVAAAPSELWFLPKADLAAALAPRPQVRTGHPCAPGPRTPGLQTRPPIPRPRLLTLQP